MSQAVVHRGLVYTAGQVDATAPEVAGQTQAVLAKIDALLARAGSDRSRILSAQIWLSDIGTFGEMNAVWERWVAAGRAPARATVEGRLAGSQYKVEIAVIAAVDE